MANISYVFTVQPGRQNGYRSAVGPFEVKAIYAQSLEVWVSHQSGSPEVRLFRRDIRLGTSIIIGPNQYLKFENATNKSEEGYFGAV